MRYSLSEGADGQPSVEKLPEANTLEVTRGVEAALRDLAPGLQDVRVDATVYRPASFVESAMSNIGLTLLIGGVLAVLLIGLAWFSWRPVVIALVSVFFFQFVVTSVLLATNPELQSIR